VPVFSAVAGNIAGVFLEITSHWQIRISQSSRIKEQFLFKKLLILYKIIHLEEYCPCAGKHNESTASIAGFFYFHAEPSLKEEHHRYCVFVKSAYVC
jgi:hypothetical protein